MLRERIQCAEKALSALHPSFTLPLCRKSHTDERDVTKASSAQWLIYERVRGPPLPHSFSGVYSNHYIAQCRDVYTLIAIYGVFITVHISNILGVRSS